MDTIAVIGLSKFSAPQLIREYVAALPTDSTVVSGGAPGVDTIEVEAAKAAAYEGIGWLYREGGYHGR